MSVSLRTTFDFRAMPTKNRSSSSLTELFLLLDKDEPDHFSPAFILSYFVQKFSIQNLRVEIIPS